MNAGMEKIFFRDIFAGKASQSSQIGINRNSHLRSPEKLE